MKSFPLYIWFFTILMASFVKGVMAPGGGMTPGRMTRQCHAIVIASFQGTEKVGDDKVVSLWKLETVLHGKPDPVNLRNGLLRLGFDPTMFAPPEPGVQKILYLYPFYKRAVELEDILIRLHWDFSFTNEEVINPNYFIDYGWSNVLHLPEEEEAKKSVLDLIARYWRVIRSENRNIQEYIQLLEEARLSPLDYVQWDTETDLKEARSAEASQSQDFQELKRRWGR